MWGTDGRVGLGLRQNGGGRLCSATARSERPDEPSTACRGGLQPGNCDGGADCAERAARLFTDLRTRLWEALRQSDQYLARPDPHAPVLSQ